MMAISILTLAALPGATRAAVHQQTFVLQPGWNAIHLEVQPTDPEIENVFGPASCSPAPVPLASVWLHEPRLSRVASPTNPADGLLNRTGWFGFFPATSSGALLTNLYAMRANRAYLVKIEGTQPVTCTVSGIPRYLPLGWQPDAFTLTGLPVDPSAPPTFDTFFEPSAAHDGQPVYRLDPEGIWRRVQADFEPVRSGEAYWIYTRGTSAYQGPLELDLNGADRLEFGAALTQDSLVIDNRLDISAAIRLRLLPGASAVPLRHEQIDGDPANAPWVDLPSPYTVAAAAGGRVQLRLAPDRARFANDRVEQILEVTNGLGARRLLLVGANTADSTTPNSYLADRGAGPAKAGLRQTTDPRAGLWVGTASIQRVSAARCEPLCSEGDCTDGPMGTCRGTNEGAVCDPEQGPAANHPQCGAGGTCVWCEPVPSGALEPVEKELDLRLILHVDASGETRLLKEVIQLVDPLEFAPDPTNPGFQVRASGGERVLVTRDDRIVDFEGLLLRDGVPVGLRTSTVAYDYDASSNPAAWDSESETLRMSVSGGFGEAGATAEVLMTLEPDFPTHPFRHKYHPDHDNLDPDRNQPVAEAPTIGRTFRLTFRGEFAGTCSESGDSCLVDAQCPEGQVCEGAFVDGLLPEPPDWGSETLGGTFREEVTGLHRETIVAEGPFLLRRVAVTPLLNAANGGGQ